jgi:hypothetical protein
MSSFDLQESLRRARRRLGATGLEATRAPRADRGISRLPPEVLETVAELLSGRERPRMRDLLADLRARCRDRGLQPPARATVYKLMGSLPTPSLRVGSLPAPVQTALYNLDPESEVPAHQVAFYCFNYGDVRAVSYAAGLPWLAIYQALRLPGYRPKSRGLVEAVARVRRI